MCIAVLKKEGMILTEQTIRNCWEANDDGAGFMYAEKGKLHIHKGYFSLDKFLEAYEPHKNKLAVLHFRIRTHGNIDTDNCHPFVVDNNLAFVHNGTITGVSMHDNTKSDTWHFNEQIIKELRKKYKSFFLDPIMQKLIKDSIGWSKLIFLNSKGQYSIVGESAGTWDSNCWFSNGSYKDLPKPVEVSKALPLGRTSNYQPNYSYKHDKELETGDICWVKYAISTLKPGDYVVIKYVYANNTVGCYERDRPRQEYRIPAWYLEPTSILSLKDEVQKELFKPGDFVKFTGNFNHFRKGDVATCDKIIGNKVNVFDEDKQRGYLVDKDILVPVTLEEMWNEDFSLPL